MNRQRFLVGLLLAVAILLVPYHLADRSTAGLKRELASLEAEIDVARQKALRVRELESQLAEEQQAMAALPERLLSDKPFAAMERTLSAVAAETAVRVVGLTLTGARPLESLPILLEYTAEVEVEGTPDSFIRFLRRLEEHRLLIAIPDLKVPLQQGPTLRTRLVLHFYSMAPGSR